MSENATTTTNEENNQTNNDTTASGNAGQSAESAANAEDVSYHAVEKDGSVTAIWEMQGRKHIRTIDPRSGEGKQILALFETAA
jgi:hypothetical protein